MVLLTCVAGPSRRIASSRALHTSCARFAVPPSPNRPASKPSRSSHPKPPPVSSGKPPPPPRTRAGVAPRKVSPPITSLQKPSIAASTPTGSVAAKATPSTITTSASTSIPDPTASYPDWPWITVEDPSHPNVITMERTLYARPDDITHGKPQRILYVWIFILTASTCILAAPSPTDIEQWTANNNERKKAEAAAAIAEGRVQPHSPEAALLKHIDESGTGSIMLKIMKSFGIIQTGIVGAMLVGGIWVTRLHASSITRLTQLRLVPSSGEAQNQIRMATAMNEAKLPGYPKYKEYDLDQVNIRLINIHETDYMNLDAGKSLGYRLNFHKLPKRTQDSDAEVVLSMSRLERVFGKLEVPKFVPARRFWSGISDRIDKWADKK